ncbi:MAG: DUF3685 domain-containing protein [Nodosilinea sp.]
MTQPPLRLMLVDDDPVFRLGLRIWLEQSAGYRVVAEASQAEDALAMLDARTTLSNPNGEGSPDAAPPRRPDLDLVILDLGLGTGRPSQLPGLQLCAEIKARYPTLPVLVLSILVEPVLAAAARQMGADGFGARSMAVRDLGCLIEQLSSPAANLEALSGSPSAEIRPGAALGPEVRVRSTPTPGPWAAVRINLRRSSVQQIEAVMAAIAAEQRRGRGSLLAEATLAGRYRELRAARWLIGKILATPEFPDQGLPAPPPQGPTVAGMDSTTTGRPQLAGNIQGRAGDPEPGAALAALAVRDRLALQQGDVATILFERVFRQLQGNLDNTSGTPLEIDVLRDDKKRELLYLTLRQFEAALDNLRRAEVPPGQLPETSPLVLQDVWEATVTDFFGRYYTLQVDHLEQPVVPTLMAEAAVVQTAILDRIPLVPMLLGHLLFKESVIVDGSTYIASTPEALNRSQELLEHLLIQIANAVIQPLLNHFADVELIKKNLYQRRLVTSRDIERFRNDLSWRYRWDGLINEPRAIFESQYRLFNFTERGIQSQTIYAPRRDELDQLSGLQRSITLVVEARDAVAPRFRAAVALVGTGLVYILTDVIGRGIGLVGRGILRGVGGNKGADASPQRDRVP